MLPARKGKDQKPRQAGLILRERPQYMLAFSIREDGRAILLENVADRSEFLLDEVIEIHPPGKWNRTSALVKDGKLSIAVNGKAVVKPVAVKALMGTGEIGLMDSNCEIEFANLFIRELK